MVFYITTIKTKTLLMKKKKQMWTGDYIYLWGRDVVVGVAINWFDHKEVWTNLYLGVQLNEASLILTYYGLAIFKFHVLCRSRCGNKLYIHLNTTEFINVFYFSFLHVSSHGFNVEINKPERDNNKGISMTILINTQFLTSTFKPHAPSLFFFSFFLNLKVRVDSRT